MRFIMLGIVLAMCVASVAGAAVRYVSPTGNGGVYTLVTPGGLDSANIVAVAGDVVMMAPGTYTYPIEPVNNGTAAGGRITYIGNLASPSATIVPSSALTRARISVKGVRILGSLNFETETPYDSTHTAYKDSIINCEVEHTIDLTRGQHCKIVNTTITSGNGRFLMNTGQRGGSSFPVPAYNRITKCVFNLGAQVTANTAIIVWMQAHADTVDSTQFNIQCTAFENNDELDPLIVKYASDCRFFDNKWTVHNNGEETRLFRLRDSTHHTTFVRDTMLFTGNPIILAAHVHGNGSPYEAHRNRWDYLFYKNNCSGQDYAFQFQDGMRGDTLTNCAIFTADGIAFHSLGGADTTAGVYQSIVDHCTFVGPGRSGSDEAMDGAVFIDAAEASNPWTKKASISFTNNIVYKLNNPNRHAMSWGFHTALDSMTANYNLYYGVDKLEANSIGWQTTSQGTKGHSRPGTSGSWYAYRRQDGSSLWGDPLLGGVTYETFDYRLAEDSPARNRGSNNSDIGVSTPGDQIRPAPLAPFIGHVASGQITLNWTAVGDDSLTGTCTTYLVRYSTSTIDDESEWSAATVLPITLVPHPAGSASEYYQVTGLTNRTFYYFVVRAVDEAGNMSALHESVCAYPPYYCVD